jgi:hypothetical protein
MDRTIGICACCGFDASNPRGQLTKDAANLAALKFRLTSLKLQFGEGDDDGDNIRLLEAALTRYVSDFRVLEEQDMPLLGYSH